MTRKESRITRIILYNLLLINLCSCDRLVVRRRVKPHGNYSDILVTKHNYNTYLTKVTPPIKTSNPVGQTNVPGITWELVALNENKNKDSNSLEVLPTVTNDMYSFNCTLLGKPTTTLNPLRQPLNTATTTPRTILRPQSAPIRRVTTPKTILATTEDQRMRKKVIYVNPPFISAVESVLDSAYDMIENTLTTKKKVRITTETPGVKKRTKKSPNGLVSTQVHVTNEYQPITQTMPTIYNKKVKGSDSSEEYYEEDLLYYDEDEDSEEEEDSIESPPSRGKPLNKEKRPARVTILNPQNNWITDQPISHNKPSNQNNEVGKKKRRPTSSSDDDSYYDDDEEEDDYNLEDTFKYGSPVREGVFDYFGDILSRFGSFITSIMGLGGRSRKNKPNTVENVLPNTTPKPRTPKQPAQNYYDFHNTYGYIDDVQLRNGREETTPATNDKGIWSGLGSWFGGDDTSTVVPESENSWFFNIFSTTTGLTTTTTEKPTESTPLNPLDPGNFLALLAQHLVASTETPTTIDSNSEDTIQKPPKKVDYSNFQLWRLRPANSAQVRFLTTLRSSDDCPRCQWWKGPSLRGPTDLVIPSESLAFLEEQLQNQRIVFEVVITDLQKAITYSNPKMTRREQYEVELAQGHPVTFYRYHRFDDIVKFLEFLQRKYPENVELSHFGRSYEGLPLIMVKVFSQSNGTMELRMSRKIKSSSIGRKYSKPVVLIEAGSHGREWISPAVAMWILNTLASGIGRNDSHSEIFRSVDWLIVPVLNPDGYEYTHTYDRLWRKTRSIPRPEKPSFLSSLSFWNWFQGDSSEEVQNCTGTDLNRNWEYEWSKAGLNGKACGDLYSGTKAFSEPESRALQQFVMKHRKKITVFLSLHSYGQMISIPKEIRGRNEDLLDMAHVAAQALNGHSSLNRYLVDESSEMLFPRPGASDSFMLNTIGVPYSYTVELRDTGTHGFLLPPSYIEATARDAFDVIKAIVDNL
ncbi:uncharacterized protein DMENIID0001_114470 [Sergentomyia squamirostris]